MSDLTITAARYGDPEHISVVVTTSQRGDIIITPGRRLDVWQKLEVWQGLGGVIAAWAWTPEAAANAAVGEIQAMVDRVARERLYDSGVSLASYVASTIPAWAAEAQAFVAWRDAVWAYAYSQLALIQAGQRAVPSLETFMAELPEPEWPTNG